VTIRTCAAWVVVLTSVLVGVAALGPTAVASAPVVSPECAAQRGPNVLLGAKTARINGQVSSDSDAALHFSGRVDFESGNAELHVPFSELLAGIPLSGQVTVRLVDDAVYADLHALYGLAGTAPSGLEGQRWLQVNDFAIPISTPPLQGLLAAGGPETVVELLRGAVTCERIGTDTVDGIEAAHYRGTASARRGLTGAPETRRTSLEPRLARVSGRITFDAWIDERGRVRKLSMNANATIPGTGSVIAFKVRLRLSAFGVPVGVEAPPPGETLGAVPTPPPTEPAIPPPTIAEPE
jgi:hypothetical protein